MHSWQHGEDWILHHDNETHPESVVIVTKVKTVDRTRIGKAGAALVRHHTQEKEVTEEMEIPFGVLLGFVCEMLQRDARAHQDDISAEEWLREQIGAPKR